MSKSYIVVFVLIAMVSGMCGCSVDEETTDKIDDISYKVDRIYDIELKKSSIYKDLVRIANTPREKLTVNDKAFRREHFEDYIHVKLSIQRIQRHKDAQQ